MFQATRNRTTVGTAFNILELIYHSAVRNIRKSHRNAVVGLLMNILQSVLFIAAFYAMFSLMGLRKSAVRGDFMLYIMSGIFLFMTHTKAMGAVFAAEGSTSAIMQHAPLNTVITTTAAAVSALYLQILSMLTILFAYHVLIERVYIDRPIPALGMVIMAWGSGVAIGLIFLAVKPWAPGFARIVQMVYSRANMITSGKMFLANTMPSYLLAMFSWNPLFHCIDQLRGFVFLNYNPHNSSLLYPVLVSTGLVVLGMMAEFFTRRRVSTSWDAAR